MSPVLWSRCVSTLGQWVANLEKWDFRRARGSSLMGSSGPRLVAALDYEGWWAHKDSNLGPAD